MKSEKPRKRRSVISYLLPLLILGGMIAGSIVYANNNEYNTTLPNLIHKTLHEGTKSGTAITASHRVITSQVSVYQCWIDYAPVNTENWACCSKNFECRFLLPTVPPTYDTIKYTATPSSRSRARLRTDTIVGPLATKWVHGEIIY